MDTYARLVDNSPSNSTKRYEFGRTPDEDIEFEYELEINTEYDTYRITDMTYTHYHVILTRQQACDLLQLLNDELNVYDCDPESEPF